MTNQRKFEDIVAEILAIDLQTSAGKSAEAKCALIERALVEATGRNPNASYSQIFEAIHGRAPTKHERDALGGVMRRLLALGVLERDGTPAKGKPASYVVGALGNAIDALNLPGISGRGYPNNQVGGTRETGYGVPDNSGRGYPDIRVGNLPAKSGTLTYKKDTNTNKKESKKEKKASSLREPQAACETMEVKTKQRDHQARLPRPTGDKDERTKIVDDFCQWLVQPFGRPEVGEMVHKTVRELIWRSSAVRKMDAEQLRDMLSPAALFPPPLRPYLDPGVIMEVLEYTGKATWPRFYGQLMVKLKQLRDWEELDRIRQSMEQP